MQINRNMKFDESSHGEKIPPPLYPGRKKAFPLLGPPGRREAFDCFFPGPLKGLGPYFVHRPGR